INLWNRLTTPDEKSRFNNALLNRVSRHTEYAPVGYLILLVFFRLGYPLSEVLTKAKRDLQKDDAYGFSDLLRLLDGLLRFDHSSFTDEQLDEIDRFLVDMDEYAFNIPERLAAIHAFRLQSGYASTEAAQRNDQPPTTESQ